MRPETYLDIVGIGGRFGRFDGVACHVGWELCDEPVRVMTPMRTVSSS